MNWNEAYRSEIELIFEKAAAETALFPAPLNELGLALLAKLNPLQSNTGTNYISFLLPFWLQEQTASPDDLCRDLAIGNVFAMIHFFLIDDVMDAGAGLNKVDIRESLVLGQLFQGLFQQYYRRHFKADSALWTYYQAYMEDWALAVSQEGKQPAEPRNPAQLARKSAPVKLCAIGMLLLSEQEERIPDLEEAVELILATLQLSDDWADWREDLAEESCNAFLTIVREQIALPSNLALNEQRVKQAIYHTNALNCLVEIVDNHRQRLSNITYLPSVLFDFQEFIRVGLRKEASDAEEITNKLASGGGLFYYLSNSTNK
ncbi:hypothetical protein [Cohnella abietis]|uniref:Uncharacterized protein n=1 Tax=Cohnella abietis TaxID=2507935 RepID=A0A3T1DEA5_9BACL|nr:hypothetical protein [Cohnella abietis]BBI36423.1 hypothetical protein KCTCHS21_58220 [Cohnella abietis]